ncbi:hypothetical protein Sango_2994400 [Sesamum angolense]|uniref:Protein kinase domain-containing protein n=1 Tax=Sesamum angolense TaxID=2727404 RepID=A0AAE1T4A1_9LAMI|nr:hypothetical protein Sango_2994400 [Sesamum angolense]
MATNHPKKKLSPIKEWIEPSTEAAVKEQDDTSTPPKPMVLLDRGVNGRDRYRIMHPIGTGSGGSLQVYKAAYIAEHSATYQSMAVQDIFVAVKYESIDPEPDVFMNLKAQVEKNGLIPDHQNLMGIRTAFFYEGFMCVVFPLMELGSMRSIMATQFPDGMPEECILVALREALKASIYDWAAAPEVLESNHMEYTREADIWLIGITALELAYGGLRVMNREALETMVTKINLKKKLPKKVKKGRGVI